MMLMCGRLSHFVLVVRSEVLNQECAGDVDELLFSRFDQNIDACAMRISPNIFIGIVELKARAAR